MEIRTKESLPATVAERWKEQRYNFEADEWLPDPYHEDGHAKSIYNQFLALNPLTAEGVEEIIGNDSWTTLYCSECNGEGFDHVIVFESWDGEEVTLCRECFGKSVEMVLEFETGDEPEVSAEDILKTVATLEPYQHVKAYTLNADPLKPLNSKFEASSVNQSGGITAGEVNTL